MRLTIAAVLLLAACGTPEPKPGQIRPAPDSHLMIDRTGLGPAPVRIVP